MVTYVSGNIFESAAQVITNTVNTVGVMGAGLALEFKKRYPEMFGDYQKRCKNGLVRPGEPYLWENDEVQILNFPTKRHWKNPSQLEDIEAGLKYLASQYSVLGIHSLALPPLGCGLGGLIWSEVRSLIHQYLAPLPDLEVFVYEPTATKVGSFPSESEFNPDTDTQRKIAASPTL